MENKIKLIFIVLAICIIIYLSNQYENFDQSIIPDPNIIFLSQDQAIQYISSDPDGYIERFNQLDWTARQITCLSDYANLFVGSVIKPTDKQVQQIKLSVKKALDHIAQIDSNDSKWIDLDLFRDIPWKFIIINSDQIDRGLPHTRYDTIVLHQKLINQSEKFVDTLLHEQLHVYQKLYPELFDIYLQTNGFTKVIKYIDSNIPYRSNPDTDDWIYKKNSKLYFSKYILANPKSIYDSKFYPINSPSYEHPREKAVYDLTKKLFKK